MSGEGVTKKRLTPEQMERAAKVYAETGNVAEAARAIGVSRQTLHDAFKRERLGRNRTLHARACEAGLRKARKRLLRVAEVAERVIDNDGVGVEPRDLAALINALSKNVDTLAGLAEREEVRRRSSLMRKKLKAEVDLLNKKLAGEHVERVEVSTDDALDERIATLLAAARSEAADEGAAH